MVIWVGSRSRLRRSKRVRLSGDAPRRSGVVSLSFVDYTWVLHWIPSGMQISSFLIKLSGRLFMLMVMAIRFWENGMYGFCRCHQVVLHGWVSSAHCLQVRMAHSESEPYRLPYTTFTSALALTTAGASNATCREGRPPPHRSRRKQPSPAVNPISPGSSCLPVCLHLVLPTHDT